MGTPNEFAPGIKARGRGAGSGAGCAPEKYLPRPPSSSAPNALRNGEVFAGTVIRRHATGWSLVVVCCPFCGDKHVHGGGSGLDDPRRFLSARVSHCTTGGGSYTLKELPSEVSVPTRPPLCGCGRRHRTARARVRCPERPRYFGVEL